MARSRTAWRFAALLAASLVAPSASVAFATTSTDGSEASPVELKSVQFAHPISADNAVDVTADAGLDVHSLEFYVGNGIGHHVYDPEASVDENLADLRENLSSQAPGGNAAVTRVRVRQDDNQASDSATRTAGSVPDSAIESAIEAAADLSEEDSGTADLTLERDKHEQESLGYSVESVQPTGDFTKGPAPDPSPSYTCGPAPNDPASPAHTNAAWIQTNDNVGGKRQVLFNANWINEQNMRKAPVYWWGTEFQLYQYNWNLSQTIQRPFCHHTTDDRFWADARLTGATMTMVVNDGVSRDVMDRMETYIDTEHTFDPCFQGAIGFGIGKPTVAPDMNSNMGDPGMVLHQTVFVDMRLKPGDNSWSHIGAANKYVQNNCQGHRSSTECMGLGLDPGHVFGGETDQLLLAKSRRWTTPAHFAWDVFADERPKKLQ